jgi:hypothetical protein
MSATAVAASKPPVSTTPEGRTPAWLERFKEGLRRSGGVPALQYATSVHPCVIKGERHLVYERGLAKRRPGALQALKCYAATHGFRLKEDERTSKRPVSADRRARLVPVLALGMSMGSMVAIADDGAPGVAAGPIEEITVLGVRESQQREYLIEAGKRFIAGPFGEVEAIVGIAEQVKKSGEHKRISTRGMVVPDPALNAIVDRYDYTFPASCGGGKFSYYEGEGFAALGFHGGRRVILDVMVGGGPFTAPKLWGPFDQILNDNTEMHLMSGNGKEDGMGMLKASYSIGMVADMSKFKMQRSGELYKRAIDVSSTCDLAAGDKVAASAPGGTKDDAEG